MNERIQELFEQAYDGKFPTTIISIHPNGLEKFAELIVRECIDIVGEYSEDGAYCQRQMIKERFGVE